MAPSLCEKRKLLAENCTEDGAFLMMMMMMMLMLITTGTTAILTTVIMLFLLLLGLIFKVFILYFWRMKKT